MTTTTKLILAFFASATLYSCTTDEIEVPSFKKETEVNTHPNYSESMMMKDSISKEGEDTDPPYKPPIRQ